MKKTAVFITELSDLQNPWQFSNNVTRLIFSITQRELLEKFSVEKSILFKMYILFY